MTDHVHMKQTIDMKAILSPHSVAIDVPCSDKAGLLKGLAARATANLDLPAEAVAEAIEKRDELGSTGIGGGIAIPHARFREISRAHGYLVRLKQPVEFDAVDGRGVDLVFLLLLPAASQLDALNALAAVARKLRDPETARRMRAASSAFELYRAAVD
jgi:PTS system nitrogen regulatory IIA component